MAVKMVLNRMRSLFRSFTELENTAVALGLLKGLRKFAGYLRNFYEPSPAEFSFFQKHAVFQFFSSRIRRLTGFVRRFHLSSTLAWVLTTLAGLSIGGYLLGLAAFDFAHLGFRLVALFWDKIVLGIYSITGFHRIWWIVVSGMIFAIIFLVRPWAIHRTGGRVSRLRFLLAGYLLLYTLYFALAWQLQYYVWNFFWVIALLLGLACHFLSILSIALLSCLTNRCPPLNELYIKETKSIIDEDFRGIRKWRKDPIRRRDALRGKGQRTESECLKQIFGYSSFGLIVSRSAVKIFDFLLGSWVKKVFRLQERGMGRIDSMRRLFVGFARVVSMGWLFDLLFREEHYVMHFDMVLSDMMAQEHARAWAAMTEEALHPAFDATCEPGIFINVKADQE
ncbi:membrane hypothetical protein [Syntrophobacter sp. SbD2]|nr:membrane hypothetical protein [Syntrophobacter sp. SbD2]